jgi:electron transfer flavoprotein alpha subunit
MCVDACPVGALSIEKDAGAGADLSAYHDLWVFCEVDDGALAPVALELMAKGRELADARGCRLMGVMGQADATDADANAQALLSSGADGVIRCVDGRLRTNDAELFARWVCDLAETRRPETILYGATDFGRELAPQVAVRLGTGLTADCTVLEMDVEQGLLQQTRPAFGGNLMATIVCPTHRPQMATVRPGVFQANPDAAEKTAACGGATDVSPHGAVEDVALEAGLEPSLRVLGREDATGGDSITSADVLVVVGRGIGSKKNLPLMRELAELLGGRLGCTRPLVEAGWCDYSCQVGQTGVSVAPKLLVSVGVSGAIQHLAGIGGAERVIAVNEDPAAPIFGVADHAVVGDAVEVVGALVERLRARV